MKPTSKVDTRSYKMRELSEHEKADRGITEQNGFEPFVRAYEFGPCMVIAGFSPYGWHMSISHAARYPVWDEIRDACFHCVPRSATMAMIVPAEGEPYVNLMENCMHLWQIVGNKPAHFVQESEVDSACQRG